MAKLTVNTSVPPEPVKKRGGKRDTVLVEMKVSEIVEKVGPDAVIQVGRKHFSELLVRRQMKAL